MQPSPPPALDATKEVELIQGIVGRYFRVYETKLSIDAVMFHCDVDQNMLEENFNRLREDLGTHGYTPVITFRRGEHTITVGKLPAIKPKGLWINTVFLAITIVTTVLAGMYLWINYAGLSPSQFFSIENITMGTLAFALPLMAILGINEMGHYFMAKRSGIPASLPFFIPGPPPLGTFGAFISIRGPIPDRKTLFNLGVSGPICGFLVAIPIAIIGLILTTSGARPVPVETGGLLTMQMPLIYILLDMFMPPSGNYLFHPTAMAGWVGFLVTAINLLPAGSLDGGHVARAILGPNAKYATWVALAAMFTIGFIWYTGWMLFGLLILFIGIEHAPPLNDITPLSLKKKFVGVAMAALLVITFVVIPFEEIPADYGFDAEFVGSDSADISFGLNHTFMVVINSTGNVNGTLIFDLQPEALKQELALSVRYQTSQPSASWFPPQGSREVALPVNSTTVANVTLYAKSVIGQEEMLNGTIVISSLGDPGFKREIPVHIHEIAGGIEYSVSPAIALMGANQTRTFSIYINSTYPSNLSVRITAIAPAGWSAWIYSGGSANATNRLDLEILPQTNVTCTLALHSPITASHGDSASIDLEFTNLETLEITVAAVHITIS
ncbi:MAG TPA: site-2 protease family protein [Thermoplasmata archaeon]|nr:site-2 protease family protein [Thermoplasmata archaeon]